MRNISNSRGDSKIGLPAFAAVEALYKRKADQCRAEQARLAAEIERLQAARLDYIDEEAKLLRLATQAADGFEQQPAHEKRKLLRYVVMECKWTNGQLTYRWKPPFEAVAEAQMPKAA